jgi:hypothetical protein
MALTRVWTVLVFLLLPGIAVASPGSCYGFFTSLYGDQILDATEQNSGSRIALQDLRDRYEDNRAALEYLHEQEESSRFADDVARGREMAEGFLPSLRNPTPDTRERFEQSREYCRGLLRKAREQQKDDTFTATMEAIEEGSVYGGDECPAMELVDLVDDRWRALLGTRLYRLDLETKGDRIRGVLALNSDGRFQELDRLSGTVSGDLLTLSSADEQRRLWLQLASNSDCDVMLSGDMARNGGSDTTEIVFSPAD